MEENIEHVKRKAEDYFWEADNLQEEMQVGEFTIHVDEDDDNDTEGEEGSATDGTMSGDSSDDEL